MTIFDITPAEAITCLHAATKFIRATTDLLKLLQEGRKAVLPTKRRIPDRESGVRQGRTSCLLAGRRAERRAKSARRSTGRRRAR